MKLKRNFPGRLRLSLIAAATPLCWGGVFPFLAAAAAEMVTATEIETAAPVEDTLYIDLFQSGGKTTRALSRAALLDLESTSLAQVYIPYVDSTVEASILPLSALLSHMDLPGDLSAGDLSVLASSYDGYFSVYRPEFIEYFEPYLVLAFSERAVGQLQLGDSPNLGPYYITFDAVPEKGSELLFDPDNKRPFGVNRIQVGPYNEMLAPLHTGKLDDLQGAAATGRKLYINNCMSCHAWKDTGLGGVLSNRNSSILAIHARYNRQYFTDYTYEPARFIPDVLMPAHAHYSKEQIDAIAEFLISTSEDDV